MNWCWKWLLIWLDWGFPVTQLVKNPPAMQKTSVQSLGWEICWRRAWQPTPVFLPGESPETEEPGWLESMGSQRVRHNWVTKHSMVRLILTISITVIYLLPLFFIFFFQSFSAFCCFNRAFCVVPFYYLS